jgi:hypothetical protein
MQMRNIKNCSLRILKRF